MSKYPKFDLLSGVGTHIIIVKLEADSEWIPYCDVDFDMGEEDATHRLIDHLNATGFNPLGDGE